jgi:hypothetical protein
MRGAAKLVHEHVGCAVEQSRNWFAQNRWQLSRSALRTFLRSLIEFSQVSPRAT